MSRERWGRPLSYGHWQDLGFLSTCEVMSTDHSRRAVGRCQIVCEGNRRPGCAPGTVSKGEVRIPPAHVPSAATRVCPMGFSRTNPRRFPYSALRPTRPRVPAPPATAGPTSDPASSHSRASTERHHPGELCITGTPFQNTLPPFLTSTITSSPVPGQVSLALFRNGLNDKE